MGKAVSYTYNHLSSINLLLILRICMIPSCVNASKWLNGLSLNFEIPSLLTLDWIQLGNNIDMLHKLFRKSFQKHLNFENWPITAPKTSSFSSSPSPTLNARGGTSPPTPPPWAPLLLLMLNNQIHLLCDICQNDTI